MVKVKFEPSVEDPLLVTFVRNRAVQRLSDELFKEFGFFRLVCLGKWKGAPNSSPSGVLTPKGAVRVARAQHWLELATRILNIGSRMDGTEMLVTEHHLVPGACFDCCLARTGPRSYARVWHLDKVGKPGNHPPQAIPLGDELSLYYHAWQTSGCKDALVRHYVRDLNDLQDSKRPFVFLTDTSGNGILSTAKIKFLNTIVFGPQRRPTGQNTQVRSLSETFLNRIDEGTPANVRGLQQRSIEPNKVRSLTETFLNRIAEGTPANVRAIAHVHRHGQITADTYYNTWRRLNDSRNAVRVRSPTAVDTPSHRVVCQLRRPAEALMELELATSHSNAQQQLDAVWNRQLPDTPVSSPESMGLFYASQVDIDPTSEMWNDIILKSSTVFF
jgi:hypothetical protein